MAWVPNWISLALFSVLMGARASTITVHADAAPDDWRAAFAELKSEFDHVKQLKDAEHARLKSEFGRLEQRLKEQDAEIARLQSQIPAFGAVRTSRCPQATCGTMLLSISSPLWLYVT